MPLLHLAILAVIQGITEFLPISSSAHLILFPALTGAHDQGLMIDAAVHVGTLAAVMLFFRAETVMLVRGALMLLRGNATDRDARLTLLMAAATVPLVVVGAAVALTGLDEHFRSVKLIAWTTIVWAVMLWLGDRYGPQLRRFAEFSPGSAVVLGVAQAISIVPGTSRSGITMTAARFLGYAREDAARLSLVMSIPAIVAVGGWTGVKLVRSGDAALGLDAALAAGLAFVAALIALVALMRFVRRFTLTPFVIYRLIMGAALMWVAYG